VATAAIYAVIYADAYLRYGDLSYNGGAIYWNVFLAPVIFFGILLVCLVSSLVMAAREKKR
jgi:hypothetical protein